MRLKNYYHKEKISNPGEIKKLSELKFKRIYHKELIKLMNQNLNQKKCSVKSKKLTCFVSEKNTFLMVIVAAH